MAQFPEDEKMIDYTKMSLADFKKTKKVVNKKTKYPNRQTGFKGIHVHFNGSRDEVGFRPTLKIGGKEIMGYHSFDFDYFGLFIAIRYYDKTLKEFLEEHNWCNHSVDGVLVYPYLIQNQKINKQIELALQQSDIGSLEILYKSLTDKKSFPFEEILNEIITKN